MWKSTIVLLLLTSSLANPVPPEEECCTETYVAKEIIGTFEFPLAATSKDCTCTIETSTQRTIQVTLPVPAQPTEQALPAQKQCVQASHEADRKTICNAPNENTYSAKKNIKITQVPSADAGKTLEKITIEYQLVNDKECSPNPKPAGDKEISFHISEPIDNDIPPGLHCSWRVNTTNEKNIVVQLHVNSTTTENQCVTVVEESKAVQNKICGKTNENKFTSSGKDVTVQYGESSTRTAMKNFEVFYRFETLEDICGALTYGAEEQAKQFKFTTKEDSEKCTWTIATTTERTIQVSLAVPESSGQQQSKTKQCVRAFHDEHEQQICTEGEHTKFTAKKKITIKQDANQPAKSVGEEITVVYQLVNDDKCSPEPKPATEEEQSFYISEPAKDDIPAGLQCIWHVNAIGGKNILVQLNEDSNAPENQCVFVSDTVQRTEKKICRKSGESQFESDGQSVVIRYDGQDTKVPNFEVLYKSGAVAMQISSYLLFVGFYQFWKF